ncbi:MAG: polysaccharide biosynthesis C-terminal domain-containing protein [Eubacterium ventriosum]
MLRSIGDTKRPLYALIVSGIINICLNLVLVIVFKLDVAGVAIATVIADCVSASLVTYFLMTGDEMVRFNPKKMSLKKEQVIKIIKNRCTCRFTGSSFSVSKCAFSQPLMALVQKQLQVLQQH